MSMTLDEVRMDAAAADYYWQKEMAELEENAISEFQQERLSSYYTEHPDVALKAAETLAQAEALHSAGFVPASLVFGVSAAEQALKNILLRPILYGLVHNEFAAGLVASLDVHLNRLPKLLFPIINETAALNLSTYCRDGQQNTLWDEFRRVQLIRNGVLHAGERVNPTAAATALAVGQSMLNDVCKKVMAEVGSQPVG